MRMSLHGGPQIQSQIDFVQSQRCGGRGRRQWKQTNVGERMFPIAAGGRKSEKSYGSSGAFTDQQVTGGLYRSKLS